MQQVVERARPRLMCVVLEEVNHVAPARVMLRFLSGDGRMSGLLVPVSGRTRATVDMETKAGLLNAEFSTVIEPDVEVVAFPWNMESISWQLAQNDFRPFSFTASCAP